MPHRWCSTTETTLSGIPLQKGSRIPPLPEAGIGGEKERMKGAVRVPGTASPSALPGPNGCSRRRLNQRIEPQRPTPCQVPVRGMLTMFLLPRGLSHQVDRAVSGFIVPADLSTDSMRCPSVLPQGSSEVGVAEPFSWPEREEQDLRSALAGELLRGDRISLATIPVSLHKHKCVATQLRCNNSGHYPNPERQETPGDGYRPPRGQNGRHGTPSGIVPEGGSGQRR